MDIEIFFTYFIRLRLPFPRFLPLILSHSVSHSLSLSLFTQYLSFRLLSLCREFLNPRKGNEGVSDNALITTERSTPTEFRGKLDFLAGPGAFQRKEGGVVRCLVETALSPHHYRPCSGPVASNALKSASVTQTRHRDHPPVVYSSRTITVEEIH